MQIPIADLRTGEISGAEPRTFNYYHEKAHIDFNRSNFGKNIQYFATLSEFFTIIFLVICLFEPFMKWFALISMSLMIFFFVFEEIYCNYKAKVYK